MTCDKYTVTEFAEQLQAAIEVGNRLDSIDERLDQITRKLDAWPGTPTEGPRADKLLLTIRDVAETLSISMAFVRLMIHEGYLPTQRVGSRVRIRRKDVETVAKSDIPSLWPKDRPWPQERLKAGKGKKS